jgi:U2 small nuclear ribonucleoprotein B''
MIQTQPPPLQPIAQPLQQNLAPTGTDVPPNQTLYLNNLNEKVKIEELKRSLFFLFTPFGEIVDIVAKRNIKMRGQAFIIFKNIEAATKAIKELQGYNFFDKNITINFAKSKSDVVAKEDGTFVPREKSKITKHEERKTGPKKQKTDQHVANQLTKGPAPQQKAQPKQSTIVPNNILFIENLPNFATEEMLMALFHQYPGFREVRLIPSKNVAFVEYDDEFQAGIAMSGLNAFKIAPENALQISYAKK